MGIDSDTLKNRLSPDLRQYLDNGVKKDDVRFALSQPISLLDLPIRILNLLESNSLVPLQTISDLLQVPIGRLKTIPQLGDKSVRVISRSLDRFLSDMLLNNNDPLTLNRVGGDFADRMKLTLVEQHIMGPTAWWDQYRIPR